MSHQSDIAAGMDATDIEKMVAIALRCEMLQCGRQSVAQKGICGEAVEDLCWGLCRTVTRVATTAAKMTELHTRIEQSGWIQIAAREN